MPRKRYQFVLSKSLKSRLHDSEKFLESRLCSMKLQIREITCAVLPQAVQAYMQDEFTHRTRHYERVADGSLVCALNLGTQLRNLIKKLWIGGLGHRGD